MYQYIGFPVPIVKVLRMNIVSVGLCPKVRVIEIVAWQWSRYWFRCQQFWYTSSWNRVYNQWIGLYVDYSIGNFCNRFSFTYSANIFQRPNESKLRTSKGCEKRKLISVADLWKSDILHLSCRWKKRKEKRKMRVPEGRGAGIRHYLYS